MTDMLTLAGVHHAQGTVRLPGSKSISNRALLLAALARGETTLHNLLVSDDTHYMSEALQQLGVQMTQQGEHCHVVGTAGHFPVRQADLFLGNAGTAFRPLTAALALSSGHYQLRGVPRMHERPIGDLVDALQQLGCQIAYLEQPGFPPLSIAPATLALPPKIFVNGQVSSQFLTALLLCLPMAHQPIGIEVVGELISKPYIEITLHLMRAFGVAVQQTGGYLFELDGQSFYQSPAEFLVEGDASSASYFLAAGAIAQGPVTVTGVGSHSIQGDVQFAQALAHMGAQVEISGHSMTVSGSGKLKGIDLDCLAIPDAAMTLAVVALFAEGVTTLHNIASWRVKETDRIAAMHTELEKLGATVESGADYIRITPPDEVTAQAQIATYDDHRMAMCFSLASLSGKPIHIQNPDCVAKTFPDYFQYFARLVS